MCIHWLQVWALTVIHCECSNLQSPAFRHCTAWIFLIGWAILTKFGTREQTREPLPKPNFTISRGKWGHKTPKAPKFGFFDKFAQMLGVHIFKYGCTTRHIPVYKCTKSVFKITELSSVYARAMSPTQKSEKQKKTITLFPLEPACNVRPPINFVTVTKEMRPIFAPPNFFGSDQQFRR